jgi:hypothetical protein
MSDGTIKGSLAFLKVERFTSTYLSAATSSVVEAKNPP